MAIVVVLVAIVYGLPQATSLWSISSNEVDDLLYENLADYRDEFNNTPGLPDIFRQALTSPDQLTDEERSLYLEHERKFFSGWETAYTYGDAGYLDRERYTVWDNWYRDELKRRPDFAWDENRDHFSQAFASHVDRIYSTNPVKLSDCSDTGKTKSSSKNRLAMADDECPRGRPAQR